MSTIFQVLLRQNFRCGRMESIRAVSMAGRAAMSSLRPRRPHAPNAIFHAREPSDGLRVFYCAGVDGWGKGQPAEPAKIWIYIQKRRVSHGGLRKETKESERKVKL